MKLLLRVLFLVLFYTSVALGSDGGDIIKKISVSGNVRMTDEEIITCSRLALNAKYDKSGIDAALKTLYRAGLFRNVNINVNDGVVHIKVEESQLIARIVFDGNKEFKDNILSTKIKLGVGNVYSAYKVDADAANISSLYKAKGYVFVSVTPKIIYLSKDKLVLVYEINEGKKVEISRIFFIGNESFSENILRENILSNEHSIAKMLSPFVNYDQSRIQIDKEFLKAFYLKNGYIDFSVTSVSSEFLKSGKALLTFKISEGSVYLYDKVSASEELSRIIDIDGLIKKNKLKLKSGDTYSEVQLGILMKLISDKLKTIGYAFVDVDKKIIKNNGRVSVIIGTSEVIKVYINRINILGNVRTADHVVRRYMDIVEGDLYNQAKLEHSRDSMLRSGYFSNVEVSLKSVSQNKIDINFNVKEAHTGHIDLGAKYALSGDLDGDGGGGIRMNFSITESNLFGLGYGGLLSTDLSSNNKEFSFKFVDPYFLDMDLTSSVSLYLSLNNMYKKDGATRRSYSTITYGGSYSIGYKLSENLSHEIEYSLSKRALSKSDSSIELESIKQLDYEKNTILSTITNTVIFSTVDNGYMPRNGVIARVSQGLAGIGGDVNFIKHELYLRKYFPILKEKDNISFTLRGGHVAPFGSSERLLVIDNFAYGSSRIRGFSALGYGARAYKTNPADSEGLGGKSYYVVNLEATCYIDRFSTSRELGLKAMAFVDIGAMFGSDLPSGYELLSSNSPRVSAGVGIGITLPMLGKLNVYYTPKIFKKESFDIENEIEIIMGKDF